MRHWCGIYAARSGGRAGHRHCGNRTHCRRWGRRSISRTRSPRLPASRSARTLPACRRRRQASQTPICPRGGAHRRTSLARAETSAQKLAHSRPGLVPGHGCEMSIDAGKPAVLGPSHQSHRLGNDAWGIAGNLDEALLAIGSNHILDRRRDHRHASGEKFRGLGRADEARGLVEGEGHDADVPSRQIGGKLMIGLRTHPMQIGSPRQRRRIDLHHRTDHDQLPLRPGDRRA